MGRRKQYKDEKHAADAKRKAEKRAEDKKKSLANLSKEEIISQILLSLADDVTYKVHRKVNNAKAQSDKRAAVGEPANPLAKRPKYQK